MLAQRTSFGPSRDLALALNPETSFQRVEMAQRDTTQARQLLDKVGEVNTGGLRDIRDTLAQLSLGRLLSPGDYLLLRDSLVAMTRLGRYLRQLPDEYPTFIRFGTQIGDFSALVQAITKVFEDSGEVKDTASPALRSIRSQIRINQQRVRDKLSSLISSSEIQKYLQENVVTVRGDRYVIPVKNEHKNSIPGIIHDRSSSGATFFIEPMAVVEINNALRELQLAEAQEVQRIVRELTRLLAGSVSEMEQSLEEVTQADLLLAKGRFSQDLSGVAPKLNQQGRVKLVKAKHPLLGPDVVPVDIQVGAGFRILVITGPNTGGKTVTLKIFGLLTLMGQTGLHLPAQEGAEISVFDSVFCDIGDEQSIEQSLSTFSGHISNISNILRDLTNRSLILLDELGAGTDPQEGAALAVAILDHLVESECTAVVTTHYSELKTYAFAHPLIENASMEFDSLTLAPTFRVILGLPGKSNALEIATRLGLPKPVIQRAREARVGLQTELDEVLGEIGEELKLTRRAREDLERQRKEAAEYKKKYLSLSEELESKRQGLLVEARREARELVAESRAQLEAAIREVREAASQETMKKGRQKVEEVARRVREAGETSSTNEKKREQKAARLQVGESVYVRSLRTEGVILELNQGKKEALVQAGLLKVTVPFKDLVESSEGSIKQEHEKPTKSVSNITKVISEKRYTVPSEIMVRGMTVEEAWDILDKYLDDAVLAGYDSIRLIHGKGQGILRSVLRQRLKEHTAVRGYEEAAYNQGGSGVTIVYLRH